MSPSAPSLPAPQSTTDHEARRDRLAHHEHLGEVARFRRILLVALPTWLCCAGLDWAVVRLALPGQLAPLLALRALEGLVCVVALFLLSRSTPPGARVLRAIDVAVFNGAAIAISLMCVVYGGIGSPYGSAIACVLVARGIALPDRWQRGAVFLGLPILAFPATLAVASVFVPRLVAQLRDAQACAALVSSVVVQISAFVILVAGGHAVWRLRRKVFEATSVGRYRLKRRIGTGGMGEVWLAYHPALKRDVAVKILRTSEANEANITRFEREVRATAELVHPNTVRLFDFGATEDGVLFYAMELLEGQTLTEVVAREHGLPPERAVYLVAQASRALAEAHRRGIVHRDVKPDNLFLTSLGGEHDFVKLLDFGIVKVLTEDFTAIGQRLTRAGAVLGTPHYMSPEQAAGEKVDARSDVYALGAVLYYALTGAPPFEEANAAKILMAHLRDPVVPPSVRATRPIPDDVEAIVLRCLEKEPGRRYASAAELAEALGACSLARTWVPVPPRKVPAETLADLPTIDAGVR
jgi:hypothetical protein